MGSEMCIRDSSYLDGCKETWKTLKTHQYHKQCHVLSMYFRRQGQDPKEPSVHRRLLLKNKVFQAFPGERGETPALPLVTLGMRGETPMLFLR